MITVYKSTTGDLSVVPIESLELGCWINMVAPSAEEIALVTKLTGIMPDFLTAPLDDEERSRIEIEEDQMLVLIDVPILRNNQDTHLRVRVLAAALRSNGHAHKELVPANDVQALA